MGRICSITTEGQETLVGATAETVLQLRGGSQKARLIQWSIAFNGTSGAGEPVLVRLARQTTDGTATGASEVKWDADDGAATVTGFHSFSAEPTLGDVLEEHLVHPQGGIGMQYPLGREPVIDDVNTSRLALVVTAPAAVNVVATLVWEE